MAASNLSNRKKSIMYGAQILVPILVPLGAFAMIFGIIYLRTRENMALIERGINPKKYSHLPAPFKSLKNGLLFTGAGMGLLIAYLIDRNTSGGDHEAIYFALIAIGGGLGLVLSYVFEKKELDKNGPGLPE